LRFTFGPVLIFANAYLLLRRKRKTLVPEHTETRAHAATAALALASAGLIPYPGAGFFGYEVVLR
jgi:hypothetical protein